jgi:hypothetical protein
VRPSDPKCPPPDNRTNLHTLKENWQMPVHKAKALGLRPEIQLHFLFTALPLSLFMPQRMQGLFHKPATRFLFDYWGIF